MYVVIGLKLFIGNFVEDFFLVLIGIKVLCCLFDVSCGLFGERSCEIDELRLKKVFLS